MLDTEHRILPTLNFALIWHCCISLLIKKVRKNRSQMLAMLAAVCDWWTRWKSEKIEDWNLCQIRLTDDDDSCARRRWEDFNSMCSDILRSRDSQLPCVSVAHSRKIKESKYERVTRHYVRMRLSTCYDEENESIATHINVMDRGRCVIWSLSRNWFLLSYSTSK